MAPPGPDEVVEGHQEALEPAIPEAHLSPSAKQALLNKVNGLVVNGVVRLLGQLTQQVNNQTLSFFAIQKGEQQWADKCEHDDVCF